MKGKPSGDAAKLRARLAAGLRAVPADQLEKVLSAKTRIDMRVSGADKADVQLIARRLGVTVTEYLLTLHKLAKEILDSLVHPARALPRTTAPDALQSRRRPDSLRHDLGSDPSRRAILRSDRPADGPSPFLDGRSFLGKVEQADIGCFSAPCISGFETGSASRPRRLRVQPGKRASAPRNDAALSRP
jgi:hypothetical protein